MMAMMANDLSSLLAGIGPAVANHFWQSAVFAGVAGLLTWALRKNQAKARYGLWLAASVKFLIPFSLLASIGSHLVWWRGLAGANAGLFLAMDEVSQPFTQAATAAIARSGPAAAFASAIYALPVLLAALWFCGFVVVLCMWRARWRRVYTVIRNAAPLRTGREVEALRRLEHVGRMRKPMEMLLSQASLEPGVFGIAQPVLVWPQGISERLDDAHLEAILAHEVWHVRRRDNLAAAIHMVVEAVFWFHPVVWWLGGRLLEERERACDEAVLEWGMERKVYAESILKVCEFCVGSPLACVSGVTGANLKKRMVRIMSEQVVRRLDLGRKLLLGAAGLMAVAAPIVFGLVHAPQSRAGSPAEDTAGTAPAYESVSIKINKAGGGMVRARGLFAPDGSTATGVTLQHLIKEAYGFRDSQISGGPSWLNSEKYDIEARLDSSVIAELQNLGPDQSRLARKRMLQALLVDRFKLTFHRETKEQPIYSLVVAEAGKLHEVEGDCGPPPTGPVPATPDCYAFPGHVLAKAHMAQLAHVLSGLNGRIVVDNTGLTGNYEIKLDWTPEKGQFPAPPEGAPKGPEPDPNGPSLFTALQEQLGLKLEPQNGPVEVLVIEHAEMPAEN